MAAKLSGAAFGVSGRRVVIEEALAGREASLLAVCDGVRALALPVARDYKRALDGDLGPNTGGMGACSPVPFVSDEDLEAAMDRIVLPTLAELRHRGVDYRGVLYAGLMLGDDGPRLVEFNVRFGDPETEVVLPHVEGDLAGLLAAAAGGHVPGTVGCASDAAVCVIAAAKGYPAEPRRGDPIGGLDDGRCDRGRVPPARRDPPRAGRRAADRRRSGARRYRRGADDRPGPRARVRSGGRDRDRRRRVPARHRRTGQRAERGVIERYALPEMAALFTDEARLSLWLEIELLALEGWSDFGAVTSEVATAARAARRGSTQPSSPPSPNVSG